MEKKDILKIVQVATAVALVAGALISRQEILFVPAFMLFASAAGLCGMSGSCAGGACETVKVEDKKEDIK
jgi:hypothetical protein